MGCITMGTVVALFRQVLALALVAGLTSMNLQAAALHVHAAVDDDHHHGPASHHHDDTDHGSCDAAQLSAVAAGDTVVHVTIAGTTPLSVKKMHADCEAAPLFVPGAPAVGDRDRIVARSHGPPSTVPHPLRAPPAV